MIAKKHLCYLATKSLSESRICDYTSITTCNIVVFALSSYIFETIEIAHSENMTTFTTTSSEDFLSIYCILTSEKSVYTESFSFLEFSYHMRLFFMKKASGLYRKRASCQSIFGNYSKSERDTLVDIDIVGSSFRRVLLFHHANHISRFIRTYGWIKGLIWFVPCTASGAAHDSHGSLTG